MLGTNVALVALLRHQCRGARPNRSRRWGQVRQGCGRATGRHSCIVSPAHARSPAHNLPASVRMPTIPIRPPAAVPLPFPNLLLQWWRNPHFMLAIPLRLLTFLCSFVFSSTAFFAWQVRRCSWFAEQLGWFSGWDSNCISRLRHSSDPNTWLETQPPAHPALNLPAGLQFGTRSCFFTSAWGLWSIW